MDTNGLLSNAAWVRAWRVEPASLQARTIANRLEEAAAEIERLRAANGLLLDALEFYAYTGKDDGGKLARSALAQEAVVALTALTTGAENDTAR